MCATSRTRRGCGSSSTRNAPRTRRAGSTTSTCTPSARNADEARSKLMTTFKLSEIQANHILDMPLRRLTRLAREELEQEHKDLLAKIKALKTLLKDPQKIRALIKEALVQVRGRVADA